MTAASRPSSFLTLDDLDAAGRAVLVRADLNVPLKNGVVTDHTRIERFIPTVQRLVSQGAKVLITSHLGRPDGQAKPEFSLQPLVPVLEQALGRPVSFLPLSLGSDAVRRLEPGAVALLENLRFDPGEEDNDPAFAARLAALADVYVNDAFSAAHRAHASTTALAELLPAYAGTLMAAELQALEQALGSPERPVLAVVGGAKVSTKLAVLENLLGKVDALVLGGGMANTFLLAEGREIGRSLAEPDLVPVARRIAEAAAVNGCRLILPVDAVTADRFAANPPVETESTAAIGADRLILDLGPESVARITAEVATARTVLWNGPLGAFETPPFHAATVAAARAVAAATEAGRVVSVAGGGDTVAALEMAGVVGQFTYVSAAGGAFLEWLEGKDLPGVAALKAAARRA